MTLGKPLFVYAFIPQIFFFSLSRKKIIYMCTSKLRLVKKMLLKVQKYF